MRTFWVCISLAAVLGCNGTPPRPVGPPVKLRYVGSSTVAMFLKEAGPAYGAVEIEMDTTPESAGGEKSILEGKCDLAGIADHPRHETLHAGVVATLVGRDALAAIVPAGHPVTGLTRVQLRDIFTGKTRNWKELGGPDLAIRPFIMGAESATRSVFRAGILGDEDYAGCQEVRPDSAMVDAVAGAPGAIGQISFSFLRGESRVLPIAIDAQAPSETNLHYPIARPLFLLWREGNPALEAFIAWTRTDEGQRVVMRKFVGIRVVGAATADGGRPKTGTLVVYTETYPYYDGGVYYYPYRPYELLSRHGRMLQRVENHRGENDETPMRVDLPPDTYIVRPETSTGERLEFFATVEEGRTTELDVKALMSGRGR